MNRNKNYTLALNSVKDKMQKLASDSLFDDGNWNKLSAWLDGQLKAHAPADATETIKMEVKK